MRFAVFAALIGTASAFMAPMTPRGRGQVRMAVNDMM